MHAEFYPEILEGRKHLEDKDIDDRIVLKVSNIYITCGLHLYCSVNGIMAASYDGFSVCCAVWYRRT